MDLQISLGASQDFRLGDSFRKVRSITSSFEILIDSQDSSRSIGFDGEIRQWCVTFVSGQIVQVSGDDPRSVLAVLPFMEYPFERFSGQVTAFLKLRPHLAFPYEVFIRAGFLQGSPHWVDCSLGWLHGLQGNVACDFTQELSLIVENKQRYNQKSRHLAIKLLKSQF